MIDVVGRIEDSYYRILRGGEQTAAIPIEATDEHLRVEGHEAVDPLVRYEMIGYSAMLVHAKWTVARPCQAALPSH